MQEKINLLAKTNMVDFAIDINKALHGEAGEANQALMDRRMAVVRKLHELQARTASIIALLKDPTKLADLTEDKQYNREHLEKAHGITENMVEALYEYAKWQYECGNYALAAEFLGVYDRLLCTSLDKVFSCLWGKLGASILVQDFGGALADLNRLQDMMDNKNYANPLMQLQQRTWLLHWSLYVFFNHPNGRQLLIDLFMQDRYMNAIQINAPYLLRYLATVILISGKGKGLFKDLIHIIKKESSNGDPIIDFLQSLYIQYDFQLAQEKLRECEVALENDYFLVACKGEFMENARLNIFETYCRIHQTIDIKMLAEKLNMGQEEAEKWIANLIKNAQLNAKIDSQAGTIIMHMEYPDLYDRLQSTIKDATSRTTALAHSILGTGESAAF